MRRKGPRIIGTVLIFLICGSISFALTTYYGIPTLLLKPQPWQSVKAEIKALSAKPQAINEWNPTMTILGSDMGALPSEVLWHQRLSSSFGFSEDSDTIRSSRIWLSKDVPQYSPTFLISKGVYDAEQWLGVIDPKMEDWMFIEMCLAGEPQE
jgi:hypothetical protein